MSNALIRLFANYKKCFRSTCIDLKLQYFMFLTMIAFTTHSLNVWFLKKIGSNKVQWNKRLLSKYIYIEKQVIGHWFEREIINMWNTRCIDPHHKLIFILYDETDLTQSIHFPSPNLNAMKHTILNLSLHNTKGINIITKNSATERNDFGLSLMINYF